jgi:hypothetical protein
MKVNGPHIQSESVTKKLGFNSLFFPFLRKIYTKDWSDTSESQYCHTIQALLGPGVLP